MHRTTILSTFIFISLIVIAQPVHAAEFSVMTDTQAVNIGASFEARVVIDTQGESINTFGGTVTFPSDVLMPLAVRDGSSIINFWIEQPRTSTSTIMRFSGITPGGFTGQGFLFSVIFRAIRSGSGIIRVANPRALRNDGAGSPAYITSVDARTTISSTVALSESVLPVKDTDPPEPFTAVITRDPALFDGEYVLIFATQDKKSGIDHYEVCEGSIRHCVVAESPYLLYYQNLSRNIFVRAVDRAGNERVATLPVFMHLSWQQVLLLSVTLIALMWTCINSRKFLTRRYPILWMFFLVSVAFVAMPLTVEAATLYLSPSSGSYYSGENFKVDILVNSDVAVNAVSVVLNFPTQRVKVIDIDKKNSVLNFWVEEPSFSNTGTLGNIRFGGAALNPGIIGSGRNIATITFRGEDKGPADISFSQSAVLANDGLGTNVNASTAGAHVTMLPQRVSSAPIQNATQKPQVIFVQELQKISPSNILSLWESMPEWVKVNIVIFIGLATILSSLLILSFGVIVLMWLWNNILQRQYQFSAFFYSLVNTFKNVNNKALSSLGMAEREAKGDMYYSVQRIAEGLKEIPHSTSFKILIKDYFSLVYNLAKRFLTKNITETSNEHIGQTMKKDIKEEMK